MSFAGVVKNCGLVLLGTFLLFFQACGGNIALEPISSPTSSPVTPTTPVNTNPYATYSADGTVRQG